MKWGHGSVIRDDLTSEGQTDSGNYRALVHDGVMPDAWKGQVEYWTHDYHFYKAHNGTATSQQDAVAWCEQALTELQELAERLS